MNARLITPHLLGIAIRVDLAKLPREQDFYCQWSCRVSGDPGGLLDKIIPPGNAIPGGDIYPKHPGVLHSREREENRGPLRLPVCPTGIVEHRAPGSVAFPAN